MKKAWFIKLTQYEYWPMWAFYLPLAPYIIFKGLLKGNIFYFTNANPGMDEYGGFFSDSKSGIESHLPEAYRPATLLFQPLTDISEIIDAIHLAGIGYPLIMKPDSGERGEGVVKISDEKALRKQIPLAGKPFMIQEYISYSREFGVFIAFIPEHNNYKILSLTEKKYFSVMGNGSSAIQSLILEQERGRVFFQRLKERSVYDLNYIPGRGEICVIHTLGNHCNGTEFINRSDLISSEMDKAFDNLMKSIDGFFYGRFDIKAEEAADLLSLNKVKIIEFNGVAAEPIHIYDSRMGYLRSLYSFIEHWKYLDRISAFNKKRGFIALDFNILLRKILNR